MDPIPTISAAVRARFQTFQADPSEQLRIKIRRVRAVQIRRLFAHPEDIDLDVFNRDVWVFESRSLLDGEPLKELYWNIPTLPEEQRQRVEEALDADDAKALELHGNYVWGTATSVYGPMLKDLTQRTQNIQNAAEFLNDSTLTPEDKVDLLKQIPGFGNNIATGLVMLFHPDHYAIYNSQSEEAIRTFGYDVRTREAFQIAAQNLKSHLGATDYLELDWFLYQENNRSQQEPSSDITLNDFVPASIVPRHDILEKEIEKLQHQDFRVLTESLLARIKVDIEAGARVGCLVGVGTYVRPAEILGDEVRFDPTVNSECHFVKMRRDNGDNVDHKITRRTIWIMEVYAQQLEKKKGASTAHLDPKFADSIPNTVAAAVRDPQAQPGSPTVVVPAASSVNGLPPRMVKVAPGFGASFWQECLQGSYICVGWDDLGDLQQYSTEAEFRTAFEMAYPYKNKLGKPSRFKMSAKANELWKFRNLQPGDLVAANDGASKILGVGTVLVPGYEYRPDRTEFHHTVRVQWDTTLACTIPMQGDWPMKTISEISPALTQFILSGIPLPPASVLVPTTPTSAPPIQPSTLAPSAPPLSLDYQVSPDYQEPLFTQIETDIIAQGLRLDDGFLRRYHLALKTRGFVILSGISGTGKTWLAEAYAQSVGAHCALVPVAPNWTTNEDLLGYLNPLSQTYHDTDFSRFLRRASEEYHRAQAAGQTPHPYHVILDEMNLARVEYYFAKFLSLMEQRARHGQAQLDLGDARLTLPPNLFFIGTVNSDETTHGFAGKVYDRAQLLELTAPRQALADHIGDALHRDTLLSIWDAVAPVAPFAFRVVDEIRVYLAQAANLGISWQEALDEQLLQKILPKLKGTDLRLGPALQFLVALPVADFPRTTAKATTMQQGFSHHGFASFF